MPDLTKLSENAKVLLEGLNELVSVVDVKDSFENEKVIDFFGYCDLFLKVNYGRDNVCEICDFLITNKFPVQLFRFNEYFKENCDKLRKIDLEIFLYSLGITNFLLAYSKTFISEYFKNEFGFKYLVVLIKNETFYNTFHDQENFDIILSNFSLICTDVTVYMNDIREANLVDVFINIAARKPEYKEVAYGCLLRVANEEQINSIASIIEILSVHINLLTRAANDMNKSEKLEREKMDFFDDFKFKQYDTYYVQDEFNPHHKINVTTTMDILCKAAINNKIKLEIYEKTKNAIKIIIEKGSEIEKRYALKLLTQLCFDPNVLELISSDANLIKKIEEIAKNNIYMKSINKNSNQVLWLIRSKNKTIQVTPKVKQIMISYNSASRDTCVNIKNELEKNGYKVWIDVEDIHGSSCDSMAKAIEESDVILMCVTEGYRQSGYCRGEANYAFKCKKDIIPLIMQEGYQDVGGWLGFIIANRIYVHFVKMDFNKGMEKLLNQISKITGNKIESEAEVRLKGSESNAKNISKWNEAKVKEWFNKDGNIIVYEQLKPCDGRLLNELYKMQSSAPEFFYNFISFNKKLDPRSILLFSNNLRTLFDSDI